MEKTRFGLQRHGDNTVAINLDGAVLVTDVYTDEKTWTLLPDEEGESIDSGTPLPAAIGAYLGKSVYPGARTPAQVRDMLKIKLGVTGDNLEDVATAVDNGIFIKCEEGKVQEALLRLCFIYGFNAVGEFFSEVNSEVQSLTEPGALSERCDLIANLSDEQLSPLWNNMSLILEAADLDETGVEDWVQQLTELITDASDGIDKKDYQVTIVKTSDIDAQRKILRFVDEYVRDVPTGVGPFEKVLSIVENVQHYADTYRAKIRDESLPIAYNEKSDIYNSHQLIEAYFAHAGSTRDGVVRLFQELAIEDGYDLFVRQSLSVEGALRRVLPDIIYVHRELQDKVASLHGTASSPANLLMGIRERYDEYEKDVTNKLESYNSCTIEVQSTKERLNEITHILEGLRAWSVDNISPSTTDNTLLHDIAQYVEQRKRDLEIANQQLAASTQDVEQLKVKLQTLQESCRINEDLLERLGLYQQEIDEIRQLATGKGVTVSDVQQLSESLSEYAGQIENTISEQRLTSERLQTKIHELESDKNSLAAKMADMKSSEDRYRTRVDELSTKIREFEQQLERSRKALDSDEDTWSEAIQNLQQVLGVDLSVGSVDRKESIAIAVEAIQDLKKRFVQPSNSTGDQHSKTSSTGSVIATLVAGTAGFFIGRNRR